MKSWFRLQGCWLFFVFAFGADPTVILSLSKHHTILGEALSALTKEPFLVGSCSAPLEFNRHAQIKTLPSTANVISKPSSPPSCPQGQEPEI